MSDTGTLLLGSKNNGADSSATEQELFKLRNAYARAIEAAQSAIRDTTRLTRLLTILNDPAPIDELLDRVLTTLSEIFASEIAVFLYPTNSKSFAPLAAIGIPEDLLHQPFSMADNSYTSRVIRSKELIQVVGMESNSAVDHQFQELDAKTSIWLPVIGSSIMRGVLILARCRPVPFDHTEVGLLSAMSHWIGLTMEQSQRRTQLNQVVEASREFSENLDEIYIESKVVSMFLEIVEANSAILFIEKTGGEIFCAAESNWPEERKKQAAHLANYLISNSEIYGLQPITTTNILAINAQIPGQPSPDTPLEIMAIPIALEGQVKGILLGARGTQMEFDAGTLQIAVLFASQVSSAIENARLYQEVINELLDRKQAEQALRTSEERFRALISSVSDVIMTLDEKGKILYVSPAAETLWGCSSAELLSQTLIERIHPDERETIQNFLYTLIGFPKATFSQMLHFRQGQDHWRDFEVIFTNLLADPAVRGIVATCHDVTERKFHEQELRQLAFHDPLTGLPNRIHFRDRLERALLRAEEENQSIAVIFLDLDGFKNINDTLGHSYGDQLLKVISERLRSCLRKTDSAARLGGDEFTILVEEVKEAAEAIMIVERIVHAFTDPIQLKDENITVSGSFGIAISTPHHDTAEELLRKADVAMYAAKNKTKGNYYIYDPQLDIKR